MADDQSKVSFAELSKESQDQLDKQRAFVAGLLAEHFSGLHLTRTKADFAILQKIVDANIIKKDETWKLQALGVVFGDTLAGTIDGLVWCEVTDEYGTDPTLRYRKTSLNANALTMISKRVEDGRKVDIQDMANWLAEFIRTKASNYP